MTILPTEPIRREHRELLPTIQELEQAAAGVGGWSVEIATDRLRHIVEFLEHHLIPHAAAEEEVLYPAIDQLTGAVTTTATMRVDHQEIASRTARLAATVVAALDGWPNDEQAGDIARQLSALAGIIVLHFRKEEEVLLPILDSVLSSEEAEALFESMNHDAHQHA